MQINTSLQTLSEQFEREKGATEKLANDISEMKDTQIQINKIIIETHQNMTSKYHTLEGAFVETKTEMLKMQNQMKQDITENRHESNNSYQTLAETMDGITKEFSEIKYNQSEVKEEIVDMIRNVTVKYHEYDADAKDIKEIFNDTQQFLVARYDELRVETNDHIDAVYMSHSELKKSFEALEQNYENIQMGSTTYIRWGRNTCPANGTEAIYSGFAG